nr:receptor-like protein 12 [Ipomoea batatas]
MTAASGLVWGAMVQDILRANHRGIQCVSLAETKIGFDFFSDFTNLTVLSLVDCYFSGTVDQKVFQVPMLQTIDLSFNEMLGGSLLDFPENGSL